MKTIVTHFNPDLDAITASWLVKKFMKGWEDADFAFVPAGKTLNNQSVDFDPNIIHVDTGLGKFDHHDTDSDVCASVLVWNFLKTQILKVKSNDGKNDSGPFDSSQGKQARMTDSGSFDSSRGKQARMTEHDVVALDRLVAVVNDIDHFREVYRPEPVADFYDFNLERIIDGWKILYPDGHLRFMDWGMDSLDGVLQTFKNKVWAEEEITKGLIFETKWGKSLGIETVNDEVIHLAQKKGYCVVARKDPRKGYVRIKSLPDEKIDLTDIYEQLKAKDPEATWFLHVSKHMILNGSTKNPEHKPSMLGLQQIIEIIKN